MEEAIKELQALVAAYGLQVLGAIATLAIGVWIARWLAKIAGKVLKKRSVDPTLTKFTIGLVKITLITFVIISAVS